MEGWVTEAAGYPIVTPSAGGLKVSKSTSFRQRMGQAATHSGSLCSFILRRQRSHFSDTPADRLNWIAP